ncbi:phosphoribosyltransferase [Salinisphaera sp.]|uniref:phosphoribosyltransferase n=1 Tax=Salinisphaera sp. TaxID=1914330 RepID=UPI002D7791C4|nr:phosphoribosyltransferase [Salinisphaera sp.]HET7312795.1 phosphoribosyltransferase [Salinisphaera sp.]
MTVFADRREAGRQLARHLSGAGPDVTVLGLPRGGVPVAFEVARALHVPLDVFVVRKIGVPGHPELAMGAIASGGGRVLNQRVIEQFGVSEKTFEAVVDKERAELARRERLYRGTGEPAALTGREVILVDDGLATGASMRAAVEGVRQLGAARVTVAVPVGAADTCAWFEQFVDRVICVRQPAPFYGVAQGYGVFDQTGDAEVRALLDRANE